ncbi:hypothetical protein GCM10027589_02400 [Actinocorallia lasiicapitis]
MTSEAGRFSYRITLPSGADSSPIPGLGPAPGTGTGAGTASSSGHEAAIAPGGSTSTPQSAAADRVVSTKRAGTARVSSRARESGVPSPWIGSKANPEGS